MKLKYLRDRFVESSIARLIKEKKWISFGGITLLIIIFTMFFWFNSMLKPRDITSEVFVSFEVDRNSNARELAQKMKEEGLIKNSFVFNVYARLNKLDAKIKSGKYLLSSSMAPAEILDKLVSGNAIDESVKTTIPEGSNLEKVALILEKNKLISKESFVEKAKVHFFKEKYSFLKDFPSDNSLEGFLFPDTYYFSPGEKASYYIERMLDRFKDVYFDKIEPQLREKKDMNLYELITLASIVEAEAVLEKERPIIAGVFYNRLNVDMPLQSCATVEFALGEHKEVLSNKDTQINSPYNTYINTGLPPGPIGAPGLSSILAVLNPKKVDYFYFVAKGDGSHVFSITYEEHIKAQREIQKNR